MLNCMTDRNQAHVYQHRREREEKISIVYESQTL